MAVRKLKNGKWRADVYIGMKMNGSPDRRTKVCATKAEAEATERAFLARKDARLLSGRITLDEFIRNIFWPNKKDLKPSTVAGYQRDIKLRIVPNLGHKYLEDITRYDVQRMISGCSSRKVATNARETLSSILGLALDLEMVPRNVAGLRYNYPAAIDHPDDHYGVWLSTFAEHHRLIEAVANREHNPMMFRMLVIGLCFGLRKGEIFGLDWEEVNLFGRTIRIKQTYAYGKGGAYLDEPKTPNAYRSIPMTEYAYNLISSWDSDQEERIGPVVRNRYGKRMDPTSAKSMMKRFFAKNKDLPRMTLFSLRHSFGTACINAGIPPAKVSAWMGHEDISTTINRYVKPKLNDLREEVNKIDMYFK